MTGVRKKSETPLVRLEPAIATTRIDQLRELLTRELLERAPPGGWTTTALARSLGVARTTVWRQLKRFAADGIVTLEGGPSLTD